MQRDLGEGEEEGARDKLVGRVREEGAELVPEPPLNVQDDEEREEGRPDEHRHSRGDVAEGDGGENRHLGQDNRHEADKMLYELDAPDEGGQLHRLANLDESLLDFLDAQRGLVVAPSRCTAALMPG